MASTSVKMSLPSARPFAYTFTPATTAFLIIDMQRDFLDVGGYGYVQCGDAEVFASVRKIVSNVRKALQAARSLGMHIIHTREGHKPSLTDLPAAKRLRQVGAPNGHHSLAIGDQGPMGRLLVRGERGHDIIDDLAPFPGEPIIDKPGKGSFWGTGFHRVLLARGITHIIIAGVTTECCVTTTLRECNDRGYECCLLSDCTDGFDKDMTKASLEIVCSQDGLFGYVGHSSEFLTNAEEIKAAKQSSSQPVSKITASTSLPPIAVLRQQYQDGIVDPETIIKGVFDRIRRYDEIDPAVWISKETEEKVISAAKELSLIYEGKPLPPLFGIPFAVKDSIDVEGIVTTVACESYAYRALSTAPSIKHLLDAGALYIGKVNLDQLATGLSGCRSPYGIPHCVYSKDHISGGSSSGSAVAVAAGLVSFAVGTDTAGSTRVPAALNGIAGFKPTKGTISARGLVPACKSLDCITVFAPSLGDVRQVWYVMDQHDALDPYAKPPAHLPTWAVDYRGPRDGGFLFGVPPTALLQSCSEPYQKLFAAAVEKLRSCGGTLVDVDYTPFAEACDLLYNASLVQERLASMGHDFFVKNMETLHPTTRSIFQAALSSNTKAWEVFRDQGIQIDCTARARQIFNKIQGGIDVLVVPGVPCHPTIKEMMEDPIGLNSKLGIFSHAANVVDLCGVTVNAGWVEEDGGMKLPFGVTFLGGSGHDGRVLDIAGVFEGL